MFSSSKQSVTDAQLSLHGAHIRKAKKTGSYQGRGPRTSARKSLLEQSWSPELPGHVSGGQQVQAYTTRPPKLSKRRGEDSQQKLREMRGHVARRGWTGGLIRGRVRRKSKRAGCERQAGSRAPEPDWAQQWNMVLCSCPLALNTPCYSI